MWASAPGQGPPPWVVPRGGGLLSQARAAIQLGATGTLVIRSSPERQRPELLPSGDGRTVRASWFVPAAGTGGSL